MTEKVVTIEAPEGYEVDKEKSSFEKIVFRVLPAKGLPKTWEELGLIKGHYVKTECYTQAYFGTSDDPDNRNVFPSKEEAEASIALAQLCQLRDRYNGGWKPDWTDGGIKYVIYFVWEEMDAASITGIRFALAFKTRELRDEFKKNFSDLIEKAKPLLG
jgi:hypothetical protein